MDAGKGTVPPLPERNDAAPTGHATIADRTVPQPAAEPPAPPPRRRPGLIDNLIPLLAALVGLIALAGAVLVEMRADEHTRQIAAQVASLETSVAQMRKDIEAVAKAQDNGTVDALLALQDRIARLEDAAKQASAQPPASGTVTAPSVTFGTGTATGAASAGAGASGDCIPVALRFMATPNTSYPICGSNIVLKVGAIGAGTVDFAGTGTVSATSFGTIPGSQCTVSVISVDEAGFAELRVSCG